MPPGLTLVMSVAVFFVAVADAMEPGGGASVTGSVVWLSNTAPPA